MVLLKTATVAVFSKSLDRCAIIYVYMDRKQINVRLTKKQKEHLMTWVLIVVAVLIFSLIGSAVSKLFPRGGVVEQDKGVSAQAVELPASWGDLGVQMVSVGVIDRVKFDALYAGRGGLTASDKRFLETTVKGNIVVMQENAGLLLNLLWALGLGNKNIILEQGQMADPQYGGANKFASTGGWTLSRGDAMNHYNAHTFIILTPKQQALVESVSGNIYRPCCDNPTIFPDCNHGMAMLGLLELLASQGATEDQMYKAALQMNSFWFTAQYENINRYLEMKGRVPSEVSPKEILGKEYSSASGYGKVMSSLPGEKQGGSSCGA